MNRIGSINLRPANAGIAQGLGLEYVYELEFAYCHPSKPEQGVKQNAVADRAMERLCLPYPNAEEGK